MRLLIYSIASMALSSAAHGQSPGVSVAIKGSGSWEVICHASGGTGDETIVLAPDRAAFSRPSVYQVDCQTTVRGRGPKVVTATGFPSCPLGLPAGQPCEREFKSGLAEVSYRGK